MTGTVYTSVDITVPRFGHAWRTDKGGTCAAVQLATHVSIHFETEAEIRALIGELVKAIEGLQGLEPCDQCGHIGDDVVTLPVEGGTVRHCRDWDKCQQMAEHRCCPDCGAVPPGHTGKCPRHQAAPAYARDAAGGAS